MCYKPVHIRVNSKSFRVQGAQLVEADVPCGHCPECNSKKKDEIRLRTFYEIHRTLSKGGFVLSQCLTYKPLLRPRFSDHLPFLKGNPLDFYCFNRAHVRNFISYVREELKNSGHDPKGCFKYFIAMEYGTDPTKDHAPHLHGLFFSTDTTLDWKVLSAIIEKAWFHGYSDGIVSAGRMNRCSSISYITNPLKPHLLTPQDICNYERLEVVSSYITEYLTKDSYFSSVVKDRLYKLYPVIKSHYVCPDDVKRCFAAVKRNAFEHDLHSAHFGDNFLEFNTIQEIYKTGKVRMPNSDPKLPILQIPLPLYFARKLFYRLRRDFDNTLQWELNSLGARYVISRYPVKKRFFEKRISDVLQFGLPTQTPLMLSKFRSDFNTLLDGRSLSHFVDYLLLYKGRSTFDGVHHDPADQLVYITQNSQDTFEYFSKEFKHTTQVGDNIYYPITSNNFVSRISQSSTDEFKDYDELWQLFSNTLAKYSDLVAMADYFKLKTKKTIRNDDFKIPLSFKVRSSNHKSRLHTADSLSRT